MDPIKRCCGNCRWWLPHPKIQQMGECHGAPPTAILSVTENPITGAPQQALQAAWPPIGAGECCGLFQFVPVKRNGGPSGATEPIKEIQQ